MPEEPEVVRDDVYSGGVGAISGTDPFVIDQTVTVAWDDQPRPWVKALLAELGETLAAHGGTAAMLLGFRFRARGVPARLGARRWLGHGGYSRWSESARLGTTKDRRKIGKMLFPLHRKATVSPSAASKVLVRLEFLPLRTCKV